MVAILQAILISSACTPQPIPGQTLYYLHNLRLTGTPGVLGADLQINQDRYHLYLDYHSNTVSKRYQAIRTNKSGWNFYEIFIVHSKIGKNTAFISLFINQSTERFYSIPNFPQESSGSIFGFFSLEKQRLYFSLNQSDRVNTTHQLYVVDTSNETLVNSYPIDFKLEHEWQYNESIGLARVPQLAECGVKSYSYFYYNNTHFEQIDDIPPEHTIDPKTTTIYYVRENRQGPHRMQYTLHRFNYVTENKDQFDFNVVDLIEYHPTTIISTNPTQDSNHRDKVSPLFEISMSFSFLGIIIIMFARKNISRRS